MYLSHFGFSERPFSNTPDPRFVYLGGQHQEALAHLVYGIRPHGGFVQLTGEIGTGKTTICRYLLEQLPAGVDVALIVNPMLNPEQLLATLCDELGVTYPSADASRKTFVDALYHHLLAAHADGRRTVLIVDEAQNLSVGALEQLRLLTNLETTTQKLLQIILIGQPELIGLLRRHELRQLAQRITARCHLLPFTDPETRAYVRHRIAVAGGADGLFSRSALGEVHRVSRGVPRLINVVCDRALLGAYAERLARVDAATVRAAAREVLDAGGSRLAVLRRWRPVLAAATVLLLVGGAAAMLGGAGIVPAVREKARADAMGGATALLGGAGIVPSVHEKSRFEPRPAEERTGQPAAAPTPGVVPGNRASSPDRTRLGTLLGRRDLPSDRRSAFASLFARWHVDPGSAGTDPCEAGARVGLECLAAKGSWPALRRLDLPAVVKLMTPDGTPRWAAVLAVDRHEAALEVGDFVFMVPLREIEAVWDGAFEAFWRPPPIRARLLTPGMSGTAVAWLVQRLDELEGRTDAAGRDVYDEELSARVLAFQRTRGLATDGVAGLETLARLAAGVERRAPSLSGTGPGS